MTGGTPAARPMTGGTPAPRPVPTLAGLALVPLGDDDAGVCVDGVCAVPAPQEPRPSRS